MSTRTANFLSYIFHPLFTPILGMVLIFLVFPYQFDYRLVRVSFVLVFLTTIIFPGVSAYFFLKMGLVKSLKMEDASDRRYPFLVSIASYVLLSQFFLKLPLPLEFAVFAIGAAISSLIALLFLSYAKISIHLLAFGGIVGGLLGIAGQYFLNVAPLLAVLFLLAGMLGTARLVLKAHKLREIYLGFATGFIVEFLLINYVSSNWFQ